MNHLVYECCWMSGQITVINMITIIIMIPSLSKPTASERQLRVMFLIMIWTGNALGGRMNMQHDENELYVEDNLIKPVSRDPYIYQTNEKKEVCTL